MTNAKAAIKLRFIRDYAYNVLMLARQRWMIIFYSMTGDSPEFHRQWAIIFVFRHENCKISVVQPFTLLRPRIRWPNE